MIAVWVGGPLHGTWRDVGPNPPHLYQTAIPPQLQCIIDPAPSWRLPDPVEYTLGWYRTGHRNGVNAAQHPAYLCTATPADRPLPEQYTEEDLYYARVAQLLWHKHEESLIPPCVVRGCPHKGRMELTALEEGRLAGRHWLPGDPIRLCHDHYHDVLRASGAYGYDYLADWLKPDATWDTSDARDAGGDVYGAEVLYRTARMMRLAGKRNQ